MLHNQKLGDNIVNEPVGRMRRSLVLVVDDVEGNRELLCRRLEPFGYDMHQVESGQAALDFIRGNKPDLVLLDYMMPVMNGVDVLNVLRQDWQISDIPVIMVTARAESDAVVKALDAGADDYVTKPIDFEVLRARMETQLAKHRSRDQLRQVNAALDERATMRVMAFDELKDELEREIAQRRQAEKALAQAQETLERATPNSAPNGAPNIGPTTGASNESVQRAIEIVDAITRAVGAGRPVNPAMLSALRGLLVALAPA
jgi:DNA-binding response OmpR family regulator